jgi:hypothetical protein
MSTESGSHTTGRGVLSLRDQHKTCRNCAIEGTVDVVLDRGNGAKYWVCPHCDAGNRELGGESNE